MLCLPWSGSQRPQGMLQSGKPRNPHEGRRSIRRPGDPPRQCIRKRALSHGFPTEKGMKIPPKASEQLTREKLAWVREWIDAGAPWPEASVISSLKEGSKGQLRFGFAQRKPSFFCGPAAKQLSSGGPCQLVQRLPACDSSGHGTAR